MTPPASPRIVFMGTPDFAVPTLNKLAARYDVVGVLTQPDRPAGRGRKLQPSPVREAADALGIPVQTPPRLRTPDAFAALAALEPDLVVVAAYGQLLRANVLGLPPHGCLNVHASLLPRHRGASPISAAILAGDAETGVTIMQMDEGLDTGPMLGKRAIAIEPHHTTGSLTDALALVGAGLLDDTLPGWLDGSITAQPQNDADASYAPMLTKHDGLLDFRQPAARLERQVRAMHPWPGAFAFYNGQRLKVYSAAVLSGSAQPGRIVRQRKHIAVGTGEGLLHLQDIQPAGKKAMPATAYANGDAAFVGGTLSTT